jgi:hypothetical protein
MGTYYLALDAHTVRTQYCLTDENGAVVKEGNVATEDVATLADRGDPRVVLEATGNDPGPLGQRRRCPVRIWRWPANSPRWLEDNSPGQNGADIVAAARLHGPNRDSSNGVRLDSSTAP